MSYWEIEVTAAALADIETGDMSPCKLYAWNLDEAKEFVEDMHEGIANGYDWEPDVKTREGEPTCYTLGDKAIFIIERAGIGPSKRAYVTSGRNVVRAKRGFNSVMAYVDEMGDVPGSNELDTWMADLICDLHHAAASRGLDMEDIMRRGKNHFDCEGQGFE
jgi:hypothetical protein